MLFDQIYGGKVSLSDFIKSLELFMESSLVELEFEDDSESLNIFIGGHLVSKFSVTFFEENFFGIWLESEFEIKIEEHTLFGCLVIETIFIDFEFGLGSFSGDVDGADELPWA